ncbi:PucR family transcriptional regulator [Streptomyces sp. 8K308]|uniref:PucR family transcriptional regulator n=1 Tax=Streptomyces sp. 8K308 TaxID=2530388 RepID=UPI0010521190|nr:PucR family transcriptional regulator [Streptomyces sp. 8K308]TDC20584.1 PucR family transcriptional regulator [Streptomyces sp. 8K308]
MLTISGLVALPRLGLSVLVPGPPGALDAAISWLHNTELPDPSGYIGRAELVLTNGLWQAGTTARAFVGRCRAAGAAGVVFGLRDATPATPPELVEACREAELPLLQLPTEVPFTAVTHAAADILAAERQSPLAASLRRGTAFTDALSSGAGADGVLRILRREHELPLAVVDRTGSVLAQRGARLAPEARVTAATALARTPPPLELTLVPGVTATLLPIGTFGRPDAALLCLRAAIALTEEQQQALSQAAHFLSMEIARRQAVRASEERFAGELVDMITSGVGSRVDVARRLGTFGIDPAQPLAVLAAATAPGGVATADLATALRGLLADHGVAAMVATGSADVVIVAAWREPSEALAPWCRRQAAALGRRFTDARAVIGVGGPAAGPDRLRTALLEARRACQVLVRTGGGLAVARLGDLPTYHVLLSRADPQVLRQLVAAVLTPIRDHDAAHGGQLEATLRVFLAHQASPSGAAKTLHLHVNSLYKRLDRISELTGRDTATLDGRLDLFLALEADALSSP